MRSYVTKKRVTKILNLTKCEVGYCFRPLFESKYSLTQWNLQTYNSQFKVNSKVRELEYKTILFF